MYRPTPSTASNHNFSNGHLDTASSTFDTHDRITSGSESDLSDPADAPNAPTSSSQVKDQDADLTSHEDTINTESSHEDDAIGSEDGDFDIETPPPAKPDVAFDELSSSEDSQKHGKRKAGAEQDKHMMNNPELYGLRRSVIPSLICGK
jgi:chromodomain-helicase-DNA-binding protein 1